MRYSNRSQSVAARLAEGDTEEVDEFVDLDDDYDEEEYEYDNIDREFIDLGDNDEEELENESSNHLGLRLFQSNFLMDVLPEIPEVDREHETVVTEYSKLTGHDLGTSSVQLDAMNMQSGMSSRGSNYYDTQNQDDHLNSDRTMTDST